MSAPRIPSEERQAELRDVIASADRWAGEPDRAVLLVPYLRQAAREVLTWADALRVRADTNASDAESYRASVQWERNRADAAEASLDSASRALAAVIMAAMPLAPGETRVPGPEDEHAAVQAVLGLVKERDVIAEDRDDTETLRHRAVLRAMDAEQRASSLVGQVEAAEKAEREAVARADRMSGYLGASIMKAIPAAVADALDKAIRVVLEPDVNGHVPSYARVLADRIELLAAKPKEGE